MEKVIVWTEVAQKDFWEISVYLKENWTQSVLNNFSHALFLKIQLLQKHPNLGFKSTQYSRFRKTLVTKHYMIIYSVIKKKIVIHRLKHTSLS
ncbi:MAG: type II toxin-antitoxin system RelE/ParE family toxin [Chitinophagaceae bacterium]|nr:type II toxin-antitoxin system RelE/ParE family toxin [Chitinophagaceae bacterium]